MGEFSVPYFCKVEGEEMEQDCGHEKCRKDPHFRSSTDNLMAFATWCTSREIMLAAEIALRKRYPSKVKLKKREGQ